jgi:hypothetical protein
VLAVLQDILPVSNLATVLQAQGATETGEILYVPIERSAEVVDLMAVQAQTIPELEV